MADKDNQKRIEELLKEQEDLLKRDNELQGKYNKLLEDKNSAMEKHNELGEALNNAVKERNKYYKGSDKFKKADEAVESARKAYMEDAKITDSINRELIETKKLISDNQARLKGVEREIVKYQNVISEDIEATQEVIEDKQQLSEVIKILIDTLTDLVPDLKKYKGALVRAAKGIDSVDVFIDKIKDKKYIQNANVSHIKPENTTEDLTQVLHRIWNTDRFTQQTNGSDNQQTNNNGGNGGNTPSGSDKDGSDISIEDQEIKSLREKLKQSYRNQIFNLDQMSMTMGSIQVALDELDSKITDTRNSTVAVSRELGKIANTLYNARAGMVAIRKTIKDSKLLDNISKLSSSMLGASNKVARVADSFEKDLGNAGSKAKASVRGARSGSSFRVQENKNQKRTEQKGFIALLIPALAKLLKKTPIWDAIKLLLLKFGKNHPLLAAGALMAGPALMAGGMGLKALGGFKGLKGILPTLATGRATMIGGLTKRAYRNARDLTLNKQVQWSHKAGKGKGILGSSIETARKTYMDSDKIQRRAQLHRDRFLKLNQLEAMQANGIPMYKNGKLISTQREIDRVSKVLKSRGYDISKGARKGNVAFLNDLINHEAAIKRKQIKIIGTNTQAINNINQAYKQHRQVIRSLRNPFVRLGNSIKGLWEATKTFTKLMLKGTKDFIVSPFKNMARGIHNVRRIYGLNKTAGIMKVVGGTANALLNPLAGIKHLANIGPKGMTLGKMWTRGIGAAGGIGKAIKGIPGLNAAFEIIGDIPALIQAKKQGGGAFGKQVSQTGGAALGSIVGGVLGTALGPLGTIIGSMIGAWVGRVIGHGFGSSLAKIGENLRGWVEPFKKIFKGLGSVFGFIGRILKIVIAPLRILGILAGKILGKYIEAWTGIVKNILEFVAPMFEKIGKAFEAMSAKLDKFFEEHPKLAEWVGWGSGKDKDNSSGTSKQGNTNFDKLAREEREKMKKEGTDKNLKDPNKVATLNAIQRLDKHTTNGIANTVDMRDLGLYGNVAATNSRPYIPVNHALRMKMLDDKFKEWGVAVDYTSNMGGHDDNKTGGHYVGNKVDAVTKDKYGRATQLSKEQENWLRANGYIGNGAAGWHDAGSGYHYDLRVAPGIGTEVSGASTATGTTTSTAVRQQTDDGVREALLAFTAANKKDKEGKRTRDLIFQATDVTGSLGCWGITQVNNSGQMRH